MTDSRPNRSHAVLMIEGNPMKELTHIAMQIQAVGHGLVGYELYFGEENITYVVAGSAELLQFLHNLARQSVTRVDNPLLDQEIRHDLRNQVAVVKGFSDLMKMDLPEGHPSEPILREVSGLSREFVRILDSARDVAMSQDNGDLAMAS